MTRRNRIWFLVLNSHQAHVLRDLPERGRPDSFQLSADETRLRDHLSGRLTRSQASARDGRRVAVVPGTDPVKEDRRRFLRNVCDELEHRMDQFDALAVVAPADVMGLWREICPDGLAARVQAEKVRNLAGLPVSELAEALKAL